MKKDQIVSENIGKLSKYRIYFVVILTILSIISIIPLSKTFGYQLFPQIIKFSVVTIFIAITTYIRKYYPYSIIFALFLIGEVYSISLDISQESQFDFLVLISYYAPVPIIVIASLWHQEKLGIEYPLVLSTVMGIVTGISIHPEAFTGLYFIAEGMMVVNGIMIIIIFLDNNTSKSKGNSRDESKIIFNELIYFKKIILSLSIFLLTSSSTSVLSNLC